MEFRESTLEGLVMTIDKEFWKNKKVFITGHTGFKGSWLCVWLNKLGASVSGYALAPPTTPSLYDTANVSSCVNSFIGDIRDLKQLSSVLQEVEPDIVIHMAAQSLVRESYSDPIGTYTTNVIGVANLLEAVRCISSVKCVLNITSDKCYENKEWLWGYRENDILGGHDPYSSSKACAELISNAYRQSFFHESEIALATARAGNVIGGGDWAKDRIIPDAISSFIENKPLHVRNQNAIRPWQHVLEPLSGYLLLCEKMVKQPVNFTGAWNFGPNDRDAQPVSSLVDILTERWGNGAQWYSNKEDSLHEAHYLKLDCSKVKSLLNWKPVWSLERSVDETVNWYKAWHQKFDMAEYTLRQIDIYQQEQIEV